MRSLLLLPLFLYSIHFVAQDTIYLEKNYKETTDASAAHFYKVKERNPDNSDAGTNKIYLMNGQLYLEEYFSSFENRTRDGKRKLWKEGGSLWRETDYVNGKVHGFEISYWSNGQLKRKDIFKDGKFQEGNTWDAEGNEVDWYPMEVRPTFPGGKKALEKYLKTNINKPEGVAGGKVVIGFVVDIDGSVTDIQIERSTLPALNLAAYNLMANMPRWEPGKQDGNAVRVKLSLPLNFR